MMATLRMPESEERYRSLAPTILKDECPLCVRPPLQSFTHWKIIQNDFPYDRIADIHHMIVPMRHVSENELTEEERNELIGIKNAYINTNYEYVMEAVRAIKSIPDHFHLHLIVTKGYEQ